MTEVSDSTPLDSDKYSPNATWGGFFSLVYGAYMFLFQISQYSSLGDDVTFANYLAEFPNPLDFIATRYSLWSSRILIETLLVYVVCNMSRIVWCLASSVVFGFLLYNIIKIVHGEHKVGVCISLALLIALIPASVFSNAGWKATIVNYVWPAAAASFVFRFYERALLGEKISPPALVGCGLAAALACDLEQVCVFVLVAFLLLGAFNLAKRKRIEPVVVVVLVIAVFQVLKMALCPGNSIRFESEILSWFPSYGDYTFSERLALGILSTASLLIKMNNLILLVFFALFPTMPFERRLWRVIACVPGILYMASVVLLNGFQDGAFARVAMRFYIVGTATPSDYTFPAGVGTTLYIVLVLVTLALCTVTLWKGFRGIRGVILSLVFLGGYGTRVMLGFSPTVYVSGVRTCLFVFLTTIVISGFMILEALLRAERRKSSDAGGESRFIPHCASEQQ